jgi:predicted transposase YbfD/YdcC
VGREAVDERSSEVVAIPSLLERLEQAGALVTIEVMETRSIPRSERYKRARCRHGQND